MKTNNGRSEHNKLPASDADAKFLGWQKTKSGEVVALYNVTASDHPSCGSTVSERSLHEMNLKIPETPPPRTGLEKM
jgi:hypothetical protein